jgi:hypothetical protein
MNNGELTYDSFPIQGRLTDGWGTAFSNQSFTKMLFGNVISFPEACFPEGRFL